jgi:exosortase K
MVYLGAVMAVVLAVKQAYSTASADQLRWILAPTTTLVEQLTGERFVFVPGEGYLSHQQHFLIAPACAGVNFLLAAFLTGALGFRRREGSPYTLLLLSALGAYGASILANALRITVAFRLRGQAIAGLTPEEVHRFTGIGVYLTCLCALFVGLRLVWSDGSRREPSSAPSQSSF